MADEVFCNNCGWSGDVSQLVCASLSSVSIGFNYCPECGSDDIEDVEEDDEGVEM